MSAAPERGVLGRLQRRLESVYDLHTGLNASAFLIDRETLDHIKQLTGADLPYREEQILIADGETSVDIAVYIRAETFDALSSQDPNRRLDHRNLGAFCDLVEELSHFVYVVWNGTQGRKITALEVELQGDVDKFVIGSALCRDQENLRFSHGIRRYLFDGCRLSDGLPPEATDRYRRASREARRYCEFIHRAYILPRRFHELTMELRRFYRLTGSQKMAHISE